LQSHKIARELRYTCKSMHTIRRRC